MTAVTVRPVHWSLYLLGLGHRLSPIGLGRVVTVATVDERPGARTRYVQTYRGDGPSLGWVTRRLLPIWIDHDRRYRTNERPASGYDGRALVDILARLAVKDSGVPSLARYRLTWRIIAPMLRLAWRYRWGGWQDLPGWLWRSCLAVWASLWCGGWAALAWLVWRMI